MSTPHLSSDKKNKRYKLSSIKIYLRACFDMLFARADILRLIGAGSRALLKRIFTDLKRIPTEHGSVIRKHPSLPRRSPIGQRQVLICVYPFIICIAILSIFLIFPKQTRAASYITGRFSKAINFDGSGDYVDMGDVSSSIKTVDFWVNPSTTTQKFLELNGSAYIDVSSGTVAAAGFTSPTIYVDGVVSSTLTTGWHHIAATTGTGINGNSVIVGKIGTTYFTGSIDSVRMYNRALSASEIAAHYSLGRGKHDNYAAKIKLSADDSNSYLDESLTNGQDYLSSFWYLLGSDNINPINFTVSGSATVSAEKALTTDSGNWIKQELSFEADQTGAHQFKFIQNGSTAGNSIVYVDNFRIDKNLADKGGFEAFAGGDPNIPSGWSATTDGLEAGEGIDEATEIHTGAKSFELIDADDGEGIKQTITVESGKWYTLSIWAKNNNQDVEAVISGAVADTIDLTTAGNNWTKFNRTYKSNSTSLTVQLQAGAANQDGFFDDISLVELDSTSTYTDPTTTTPSSEANSYATGKWSGTQAAFLMDGADKLSYNAPGVLNTASGTIAVWWKPVWDYDKFSQNVYLFDAEDATNKFMRLFYDYNDYKFVAHLYNGANWTTVTASSTAMTLTSMPEDTWRHISVIYGNDEGTVRILVDGAEDETDSYTGAAWTEQTTPTNFYIGSLYGASANTNQADGWFDDIRIYGDSLATSTVNAIYAITPDAPTNATWKFNLADPIIDD